MCRYLVVLLLAGCATQPQAQYRWAKLDGTQATQQEFERASGQCEAQALQSHPGHSIERGVQIFGACMRGMGWVLVER